MTGSDPHGLAGLFRDAVHWRSIGAQPCPTDTGQTHGPDPSDVVRSLAVGRYRVTCDAPMPSGYGTRPPCAFNGYRTGSREQVEAKPCPRCGGDVQAMLIRREAS